MRLDLTIRNRVINDKIQACDRLQLVATTDESIWTRGFAGACLIHQVQEKRRRQNSDQLHHRPFSTPKSGFHFLNLSRQTSSKSVGEDDISLHLHRPFPGPPPFPPVRRPRHSQRTSNYKEGKSSAFYFFALFLLKLLPFQFSSVFSPAFNAEMTFPTDNQDVSLSDPLHSLKAAA